MIRSIRFAPRAILAILVTAALASSGCGLAYPAAGAVFAGGSDSGGSAPPANAQTVATIQPIPRQAGDVRIDYVLSDAEGDTAGIIVDYTTPAQGGAFALALERPGGPSEGVSNLATGANGTAHVFVWNAEADLGLSAVAGVQVRITPIGGGVAGAAQTTPPFIAGNDAPEVTVAPIAPSQTGLVVVSGTIFDSTSDPSDLEISFEAGSVTGSATIAIGTTAGLATAPVAPGGGGKPFSFAWSTTADVGSQNQLATLFIVPRDGLGERGAPVSLTAFIQNNDAPIVFVNPVARRSGNIDIDFVLIDAQSDLVDLAVTGQAVGPGGSPVVPLTSLTAASGSLQDQTSSPGGVAHRFTWNSAADILPPAPSPLTSIYTVTLEITPIDAGGAGLPQDIGPFIIGNEAPDLTLVRPPSSPPPSGVVTLTFILTDSTSDAADVQLRWSTPMTSVPQPLTLAVGSATTLTSAPAPATVQHTVGWNTIADLGSIVTDVTVFAQPSDRATGAPVVGVERFVSFRVENNDAPVALVTAPQQNAVVDVSGGALVPIDIVVLDAQGDVVSATLTIDLDGTGPGLATVPAAGAVSIISGTGTWNTSTRRLEGLASSATGVKVVVGYSPQGDGVLATGGDRPAMQVVVQPRDPNALDGALAASPAFKLDINVEPTVAADGPVVAGALVSRVESRQTGPSAGSFDLRLRLTDPDNAQAEVRRAISVNNGAFGATASAGNFAAGSAPVTSILTIPASALGAGAGPATVEVRLTAVDGLAPPLSSGDRDLLSTGAPAITPSFTFDDTRPLPSVTPATLAGTQSHAITVPYTLTDPFGYTGDVSVRFSLDGGPFATATAAPGGEALTGRTMSPGGSSHTFRWNSDADISTQRGPATLEFRVTNIPPAGINARTSPVTPTAQTTLNVSNALEADLVIGQPAFTIGAVDNQGINYDGNGSGANLSNGKLMVCDSLNRRIMCYTSVPTNTFEGCDLVLGQPDFTHGDPGPTSFSFGVDAFFDGTRLFVIRGIGCQIWVWDTFPTTLNEPPDRTYSTFDIGGGFLSASGFAFDADGVWIVDRFNHAVRHFDLSPLPASGTTLVQDKIVGTGASGATTTQLTTPSNAFVRGTRLIVADSGNSRVQLFNITASMTSPAAAISIPTPSAPGKPFLPSDTTMYVACNDSRLYLYTGIGGTVVQSQVCQITPGINDADVSGDATHLALFDFNSSRVLLWSPLPAAGTPFDSSNVKVIGQQNLTANLSNHVIPSPFVLDLPGGVEVDGSTLYVGDVLISRALVWNTLPNTFNIGADFALYVAPGASNLTTIGTRQALGVSIAQSPGGQKSLFIANSSRLDLWKTVPTGPVAPDFFLGGSSGTGANELRNPSDVCYDRVNQILAVADFNNRRALLWHNFDPQNVVSSSLPASITLGEASFGVPHPVTANAGNFNRVSSVLLVPGATSAVPCKLLVGDWGGNRVLIYNDVRQGQIASGAFANVSIGSASPATLSFGGASRTTMRTIGGIERLDDGRLFIADRGNHRVLIFNSIPTTSGAAADALFGQPTFTASDANEGGVNESNLWINNPQPAIEMPGIAVTRINGSPFLFISDSGNNRVLRVPIP